MDKKSPRENHQNKNQHQKVIYVQKPENNINDQQSKETKYKLKEQDQDQESKQMIQKNLQIIQQQKLQFFDIAANLTSQYFKGMYKGKRNHPDDLKYVISRYEQIGGKQMLISSTHLEDAKECLQLCKQYSDKDYYMNVGVHPSSVLEIQKRNEKSGGIKQYFKDVREFIIDIKKQEKIDNKKHIICIGECGLDYDRLNRGPKENQLECFPYHFDLAEEFGLPMYFHNRNSSEDFYQIVAENRKKFKKGVLHSFTGDEEELYKIIELDLHISLNGLAFKKKKNYKLLKQMPLERLMIETDAPYCSVKNWFDGYKLYKNSTNNNGNFSLFNSNQPEHFQEGELVEGRNEPCNVYQVMQLLALVLEMDEKKLADILYENTINFFDLKN